MTELDMVASNVCATEDAVQAFLEHLVDPLLPAKSSVRDKPTPSQQELVAKQVHSVVLLYNYYHRKQHPELEYLPFNEFSKLAVVLRPSLLAYMQFMQKLNEAELTDVEKQLSLPEKMIMNACDVCKCLDASKNAPNIDGWPISKVAVLLIDNKRENCLLLFGSITRGVWSVVEKDMDTSSPSSEVASGTKPTYKNKRVIRKPTKNEFHVEAQSLQIGYSAVKEAVGINKTDLTHLGSYTVYSQSKEKAASRFYIMQCKQSINHEVVQVPLKDLIESLQGSLIKMSSSCWTISPVVDYFHVLPYAEIISEWISREAFSNSLQDLRVTDKNIKVDSPEVTESYTSEDTPNSLDSKPSGDYIESLKQKENNGSCMLRPPDLTKEPCDMDVDGSSILPTQNKEKFNCIANTTQVGEDQGKNNPSVHYKSNGSANGNKHLHTSPALSAKNACASQNKTTHCCQPSSARLISINFDQAVKVDSTRTEGEINNQVSGSRICGKGPNTSSVEEKDAVYDLTLVSNHSRSDLEKIKILLDSKGKLLSQTALTALIGKRNELALQQRQIEDEIAMCDKKIQRILTEGEDDVELKIDSIIEGCNDIWARNEERTSKHQSLSPCIKRKKLTEAAFVMQSPCQELDGICHENNWVLPTYRLSQKDGGFLAEVNVKGVEFQFACGGNTCSNPREARDSAAARMLANFRSMAKPDK